MSKLPPAWRVLTDPSFDGASGIGVVGFRITKPSAEPSEGLKALVDASEKSEFKQCVQEDWSTSMKTAIIEEFERACVACAVKQVTKSPSYAALVDAKMYEEKQVDKSTMLSRVIACFEADPYEKNGGAQKKPRTDEVLEMASKKDAAYEVFC